MGRTATLASHIMIAGRIEGGGTVKKNLTLEQRVHNAIGSQTCEDYKSRHAYLHTVCYQREEFDVMWLKSPNITWAHQFGRMVGWEENYYNHVIHTEISYTRIKSEMMKKYEMLGGHDFRAVTSSGIHVIGSDVIEVAEDGMSVRASYLTPGTMTSHMSFDSDSKSGTWIWERYGSEFVFVDGEWKWFHEDVCPDVDSEYDHANWAQERYIDYVEGRLKIGDMGGYPDRLTEPDVRPHHDYAIVVPIQDTVPPPKPYKTLDDENTYSPGRTDPTGKITVKTDGSKKMDWGFDPNETYQVQKER